MTNIECSICCEKYNKSNRKIFYCQYDSCNFEACKDCIKKNIINTNDYASCIICKKIWSDSYLIENINKSFFRTTYKEHIKNILFENELTLIPQTMSKAEEYISIKNLKKHVKDINKLKNVLNEYYRIENSILLNDSINYNDIIKHYNSFDYQYYDLDNNIEFIYINIKTDKHNITIDKILNNYYKSSVKYITNIHIYKNDILNIQNKRIKLIDDLINYNTISSTKDIDDIDYKCELLIKYTNEYVNKISKIEIILLNIIYIVKQKIINFSQETNNNNINNIKCPNTNCNALLSSEYICNICNYELCSKCMEIKSENYIHVCNDDNIKTSLLINQDTKPCPYCYARIYKIDGCSQMWCTNCHTTFSWDTGNIEKGKIHNPHYHEYQRKSNNNIPRNPHDIVCGGLTNKSIFKRIRKYFNKYNFINKEKLDIYNKLCNIYELLNFINDNKLPLYRNYVIIVNTNQYNETIRIRYIINEINKDIMKNKIYDNFIKKDIFAQKLNILELINDQGIDLFNRLDKMVHDKKVYDKNDVKVLFNNIIYEFDELCKYCNNILKDISLKYNRNSYNIDIVRYKLNTNNYSKNKL